MKSGLRKIALILLAAVLACFVVPFLVPGKVRTETYVVPKGFVGWAAIIFSSDPNAPKQPQDMRVEIPASGFVEVPYRPIFGSFESHYLDTTGAPVHGGTCVHCGSSEAHGKFVEWFCFFVGTEEQLKSASSEDEFTQKMLKTTKRDLQ